VSSLSLGIKPESYRLLGRALCQAELVSGLGQVWCFCLLKALALEGKRLRSVKGRMWLAGDREGGLVAGERALCLRLAVLWFRLLLGSS
jgi:hypothetical protein